MKVSGELHAPGRFISKERTPDTHWLREQVGPRAGLDALEKRNISACAENRTPIPRLSSRWSDT
jgi:hypothetical protein